MIRKSTLPDSFMISSVLFDMDGVVIDSMSQHEKAWRSIFHDEGVALTPEDVLTREGMSGPESLREIFLDKNLPQPEDNRLHELIEKKHRIFDERSVEPFHQIVPCLSLLRENDIPMALVTGSHIETVERILPEEIRKYFGAVITADHVTSGKPSPEPYLKALEKLRMTGDGAIAVENAPMGILSAKNAGLYCVALETTLRADYLAEADVILSGHDKLYAFLKDRLQSTQVNRI